MATPTPLPEAEVQAFLRTHGDWRLEGGALARTFEAPTFLAGVAFVDQVAKLAEAADHHPDIDIRWRKVTLRFVTHDAGNRVTALDARLADECDLLFRALPK
ncbi:MAG: 4a-hydroxytetrahydrobiopterin dehydratase [Myxococcales bacterium]|nr:4a-hydroxytetrahydrobiopterin dehydratase [Myxococcales bacterium]